MQANEHQLASLVYVSAAQRPFSQSGLDALEDKAQRTNGALEISGFLLFRSDMFVQYLEGRSGAIQDLFDRIDGDPRHTITRRVDVPIVDRRFPEWDMRLLRTDSSLDVLSSEDSLHELLAVLDAGRGDATSLGERVDRIASLTRV